MFLITLIAFFPAQDVEPKAAALATVAFADCVFGKAKQFALSTEEAAVVVDTAMGACENDRRAIRPAVTRYVVEAAKDVPAKRKQEMIERFVLSLEERVRNGAYQMVIKVRTPTKD